MSTIPSIVSYSSSVGHTAIPAEYADKAVSAILIKVKDGYDARNPVSKGSDSCIRAA